jgi:hypothetical protein
MPRASNHPGDRSPAQFKRRKETFCHGRRASFSKLSEHVFQRELHNSWRPRDSQFAEKLVGHVIKA